MALVWTWSKYQFIFIICLSLLFLINNNQKLDSTGSNVSSSRFDTKVKSDSEENDTAISIESGFSSYRATDDEKHIRKKEVFFKLQMSTFFEDFRQNPREISTWLSRKQINAFHVWMLAKQNEFLQLELQKLNHNLTRKLDDLMMNKGGQPIKNMVVASWRSGSTFVGDILNYHPGTYYHYEPFAIHGSHMVRSGKLAEDATWVAQELFNCRFENFTSRFHMREIKEWFIRKNPRVGKYCEGHYDTCFDPNFLSSICKLFPYQIMKTVRFRLKAAKSLLDDHKLNLKTLLLVRDPRGIMQSRRYWDGCISSDDCHNASVVCSDLVDDYYAAKILYKKAMRYEDIAQNPFSATKKLYKFFGLQYSQKIEEFLQLHTTEDDRDQNMFSTFRNSRNTAFKWKTHLSNEFTTLSRIQNSCTKAMHLWGYLPVIGKHSVADFHPVGKPPWKDMFIFPDNKN